MQSRRRNWNRCVRILTKQGSAGAHERCAAENHLFSPINGIVSYLPVRLGELRVPGIQNATGSFLMTLSDMSIVTSEVKVDETDIVNVKLARMRMRRLTRSRAKCSRAK